MFKFDIAPFVPYKNREVLERVRKMSGKDLEKHPNPNFRIKVVFNPGGIWIADMFARIKQSDERDEKLVMIVPNPAPAVYQTVGALINMHKVNCRNVHIFTMDEWADQDGNIATAEYERGFSYSAIKYLWGSIDESLRMPLEQVHYPTTANIKSYSGMITDCGNGGADIVYSGPGWAGHIAFVDPLTPEFGTDDIDEFLEMGARVVTLNPMTIMQNSLHGCFGCSGDIANVPPKAASIGPADVKRARHRIEMHDLATMGSFSSWQRMISRLVLHGEVTPLVPSSILQLMDVDVFVSETIAKPIEFLETVGY